MRRQLRGSTLRLLCGRGLHPAAQHFRDAPRLRHAAARRVGLLGIEDLADRPDTRFVEMRQEPVEERARLLGIVRDGR